MIRQGAPSLNSSRVFTREDGGQAGLVPLFFSPQNAIILHALVPK
jgi:hypothetical protein